MQEMHLRGILCLGTHNLNYSHSNSDLHNLLQAYDDFFYLLSYVVKHHKLTDYLQCDPLQPLFKVR